MGSKDSAKLAVKSAFPDSQRSAMIIWIQIQESVGDRFTRIRFPETNPGRPAVGYDYGQALPNRLYGSGAANARREIFGDRDFEFDEGDKVFHTDYFEQPETVERLGEWLRF